MITEIGLITSALELTGWGYLYSKSKRDAIDKNLTRRTNVREFPLLDKRLKSYLNAKPNRVQKVAANRIIILSRFVVFTRAFEYLVFALMDPNSRVKKDFGKIQSKYQVYKLGAK